MRPLLILGLALAVPGCLFESVARLPAEARVLDPTIVGSYYGVEEGGIRFDVDVAPSTTRGFDYDLVALDEGGAAERTPFTLYRVGEHRYAMAPTGDGTFHLTRYTRSRTQLVFRVASRTYFEDNPGLLPDTGEEDGDIISHASPAQLEAFLLLHGDDDELFPDEGALLLNVAP